MALKVERHRHPPLAAHSREAVLDAATDFMRGPGTYVLSRPPNVLSATFLTRLASSGNLNWAIRDDGPPGSTDLDGAAMLAVGTTGTAFVTSSGNMWRNGVAGSLAQVNSNGAWGWTKPLSVSGLVVALDSAGNAYVTAQDQGVVRYLPTGATTWTTATTFNASDMAVNAQGEVFFVGSFRTAFNVSPGPGTQMLNPPGSTFVPFVVKWTQR